MRGSGRFFDSSYLDASKLGFEAFFSQPGNAFPEFLEASVLETGGIDMGVP